MDATIAPTTGFESSAEEDELDDLLGSRKNCSISSLESTKSEKVTRQGCDAHRPRLWCKIPSLATYESVGHYL